MLELSILFATNCLSETNPCIKYPEYISFDSRIIVLDSQTDHTRMDERTDRRTDGWMDCDYGTLADVDFESADFSTSHAN